MKTERKNAKKYGLKDWFKFFVERAIDEDTLLKDRLGQSLPFRRKGIVSVGIALPNTPIATMDIDLGALISCNINCAINGFFLSAIGS